MSRLLQRLARAPLTALALGALAGAVVAALIAPLTRELFPIPTGGVGATTVLRYPKAWDYAVVALLIAGAFLGALITGLRGFEVSRLRGGSPGPQSLETSKPRNLVTLLSALLLFLAMLFTHDHPFSFMDMYHEGEHLAPASFYLDGARPYGDVFVLHGLATDGGLDVLLLGERPSPLRTRRLETVLDALALALLAPIAAELTLTALGMLGAFLVGLTAVGAGLVPVFPYYRWIPLLLAVLALLRYLRTERRAWLLATFLASTLGLLWSVEIGLYSIAAAGAIVIALTLTKGPRFIGQWAPLAVVAGLAPLAILLVCRADLHHFFADSFVAIPRAADAIAALPARPLATIADAFRHPLDTLAWETARYYFPPLFYGFALALALHAWARGERTRALQIATVALFSIAAFRTAAGRCSWSHTRFGIPLLGVAVVAFLVEPAVLKIARDRGGRAWRIALLALLAFPFAIYFQIVFNVTSSAKFMAGWRARQRHEGLVRYPMDRGHGIWTYAENAADLAALDDLVQRAAPKGETILDLSGERALYYFLDRRAPVRCVDVGMLSPPAMSAEALRELDAHPPRLVIVHGQTGLDELDGVSNRQRAPAIFAWVDAHLPRRMQAGRYTVALPP